jgi:RNA polymerase sigma-70 factor (ECF subfamily)
MSDTPGPTRMSSLDRTRSAPAAAIELLDHDLVEFVRDHQPRLIRLAALVCHNVADAEDAVQTGLEQAWRRRRTLRDPEKLSAWLDRIIVREAIRHDRRGSSLLSRLFPGPREIVVERTDLTDAVGSSVTGRDSIRIAFESLPAAQRAVVALHLYAGYSMPETAEIVGASLETVRSRLRLARARLRSQLGEDVA